MANIKKQHKQGFTLIEMTIVLIIFSILIGAAFSLLKVYTREAQEAKEAQKLYDIRVGIAEFMQDTPDIDDPNRFPCPASLTFPTSQSKFGMEHCENLHADNNGVDDGDGIPDVIEPGSDGGAAITEAELGGLGDPDNDGVFVAKGANGGFVLIGTVPTRTIGIASENASDTYGNRRIYGVSVNHVIDDDLYSSGAISPPGLIRSMNQIEMFSAADPFPSGGTYQSFVLLSTGPNAVGAYNYSSGVRVRACVDNDNGDARNCKWQNDNVAVFRDRTEGHDLVDSGDGSYFDDSITFSLAAQVGREEGWWYRPPGVTDYITNKNGEGVTVLDSGSVGIGTKKPLSPFHVNKHMSILATDPSLPRDADGNHPLSVFAGHWAADGPDGIIGTADDGPAHNALVVYSNNAIGAVSARSRSDSNLNTSNFSGFFGRGSYGAPAFARDGDMLTVFEGRGFDVQPQMQGGVTSLTGAGMGVFAAEDFDTDSMGSDVVFFTVPAGLNGFAAVNRQERARITSEGYVGIGTADPAAFLHVADPGSVVFERAGSGMAIDPNNNGTTNYVQMMFSGGAQFYTNAANYQSVSTAGATPIMYLSPEGFVGVQTADPNGILHVYGSHTLGGSSGTSIAGFPGNSVVSRVNPKHATYTAIFQSRDTAVDAGGILIITGEEDDVNADESAITAYDTHARQEVFDVKANTGDTYIRGKVGIGVPKPSAKLQVEQSRDFVATEFLIRNNYPGRGSRQPVSLVFQENIGGTADNAAIGTFMDGSGTVGLAFTGRTDPDSDPHMVVTHNGRVGIGTVDPRSQLHIRAESAQPAWIYLDPAGGGGPAGKSGIVFGLGDPDPNEDAWQIGTRQSSDSLYIFYRRPNGSQLGNVTISREGNMTITGTYSPSDRKLKENIEQLEGALEKMEKLRGVTYTLKDKNKDQSPQIGVIAQEVEAVFPELVRELDDGTKTVNYAGLVSPLIEAVKELKAEKDTEIALLRDKNEALEARVASLESKLSPAHGGFDVGWMFALLLLVGSGAYMLRKHRV